MYNSYPYTNYGMPMQQRFNAPDNSFQMYNNNSSNLKGRIVSSLEEVKASQIDFDGSTYYFICPGENKIYTKTIGLNGMPVYGIYVQTGTQPVNEFQALSKRVEELEKLMKGVDNESDAGASK